MTFAKVDTVEVISATQVIATGCEGRESETVTQNEFLQEDGHWFDFGRPDPETDDPATCTGDFQERYFVLSNDHYRIQGYCDGSLIGSVDRERVRASPRFDFGEAMVSFDSFPDLSATDDVCGNFDRIWLKYEAAQNAFVNETIEVSLPYQGSYLNIALSGAVAKPNPDGLLLTEGTYIFDEVSTGLILESPLFETQENHSNMLLPASGSLTITNRDELSIHVRFEFTTSDGEHVQGSFSVNLQ